MLCLKLGKDLTYLVQFDAPAAANFSVDTTYGVASTASVYTRMVDTALDNTAENMNKRVFEKEDPTPFLEHVNGILVPGGFGTTPSTSVSVTTKQMCSGSP